jgi:hypothetical protein
MYQVFHLQGGYVMSKKKKKKKHTPRHSGQTKVVNYVANKIEEPKNIKVVEYEENEKMKDVETLAVEKEKLSGTPYIPPKPKTTLTSNTDETFGILLSQIGPNIINLLFQSVIGIGISTLLAYSLFSEESILYDLFIEFPTMKNAVMIILSLLFINGLFGVLGLIRYRIKIYEKGIIIKKLFRNIKIRNEQIDHLDWIITSYWAGFIPVGKKTVCQIFSTNNFRLATIDGNNYSSLNKKLNTLELRLGI